MAETDILVDLEGAAKIEDMMVVSDLERLGMRVEKTEHYSTNGKLLRAAATEIKALRGQSRPVKQTIETAPRDGSMFIAFSENNYDPGRPYIAWWAPAAPGYQDEGFAREDKGFGHHGTSLCWPTHWMPLDPSVSKQTDCTRSGK